jgi:hypothetical protein
MLHRKTVEPLTLELLSKIQGFTYFEDAEPEPMPKMFTTINWGKIKSFILQTAKKEYL